MYDNRDNKDSAHYYSITNGKLKMKLSTIVIALSLAATSVSSMANNVVFKPMNNKLETQACSMAASEGLDSVKALVSKERVNFGIFKSTVTCNGVSLVEFAKMYHAQAPATIKAPTITLVAKNTNTESMVCLDALVIGEQQAIEKHNVGTSNIVCNNQNLKSFVLKYQNQNVIVRNSAE